jgi:hypothetical protein
MWQHPCPFYQSFYTSSQLCKHIPDTPPCVVTSKITLLLCLEASLTPATSYSYSTYISNLGVQYSTVASYCIAVQEYPWRCFL